MIPTAKTGPFLFQRNAELQESRPWAARVSFSGSVTI